MTHAAAIFDMDGLLIDSERTIRRVWAAAAAAQGLTLDDRAYTSVIGVAATDSDRILRGLFAGADFEQARAAVRAHLANGDAADLYPPKPGAVELLAELRRRGVPCAVASSTVTAEAIRRLKAVDVLGFLGLVVGGDLVARGKPSPDLYLLAASQLGQPPGNCLAFEDSDHGVAAAHAAGMQVVLIPDLAAPRPDTVGRAFAQLGSLGDVLPWLDAWFVPTR